MPEQMAHRRGCYPQYVHPNHSRIASAVFSEIPGIAAISLALAFRMRSTLPNFCSSACFFFGETAGQSSNRLSYIRRRESSAL